MSIVIVIGLPGSGKTTYCYDNFETYLIFDDYISMYHDNKMIDSLKKNKNVCINDPRLCIYEVFERHIKKIKKYVDNDEIKIILFENELNKCLNNNKNRGYKGEGMEKTINNYSKIYSLSNYMNYNYEIVKCYQHN
jgi:predicted kinase